MKPNARLRLNFVPKFFLQVMSQVKQMKKGLYFWKRSKRSVALQNKRKNIFLQFVWPIG